MNMTKDEIINLIDITLNDINNRAVDAKLARVDDSEYASYYNGREDAFNAAIAIVNNRIKMEILKSA